MLHLTLKWTGNQAILYQVQWAKKHGRQLARFSYSCDFILHSWHFCHLKVSTLNMCNKAETNVIWNFQDIISDWIFAHYKACGDGAFIILLKSHLAISCAWIIWFLVACLASTLLFHTSAVSTSHFGIWVFQNAFFLHFISMPYHDFYVLGFILSQTK